MNEKTWWSTCVKPRWHNLAQGCLAIKVQDAVNKGLPDVECCFNGVVLKVELKYTDVVPARSDTKLTFSRYSKDEPNRRTILSREQVRNLEEWHEAGGNAEVLIGVHKRWFLVPVFNLIGHHAGNNDGLTVDELSQVALFSGADHKSLGDVPLYFGR